MHSWMLTPVLTYRPCCSQQNQQSLSTHLFHPGQFPCIATVDIKVSQTKRLLWYQIVMFMQKRSKKGALIVSYIKQRSLWISFKQVVNQHLHFHFVSPKFRCRKNKWTFCFITRKGKVVTVHTPLLLQKHWKGIIRSLAWRSIWAWKSAGMSSCTCDMANCLPPAHMAIRNSDIQQHIWLMMNRNKIAFLNSWSYEKIGDKPPPSNNQITFVSLWGFHLPAN